VGNFQAPALLKVGISAYWRSDSGGRNRWGDFSASQVDPVNDSDLWTIQEYAGQYVGTLTNGSGRWSTWWGSVSVTLPANDDFANTYVISGIQGTTNGTTLRSTREGGEPNHAGIADTPSVWYRWVAPAAGNVSFTATNNTNSTFTVVLAAYAGSAVNALTLKTNGTGATAATIAFNAVSNTTYQIAVAAANGGCGDFILQYLQPTPPAFIQQPISTNIVANVNEDAIFNSMAIGTPDPVFQWKFYGTNTSPTTNAISGATNASYTLSNGQGTNAGNYFCVATNISGSATSAVAALFIHGDSAARLGPIASTTNKFWFQIWGLTNRAYRIETSTNLIDWSSIFTNYVSYWYTNSGTTNDPQRFYRSITNN